MALLFIDGFDEYDTSTQASFWYEVATQNANVGTPYYFHKDGVVYNTANQYRTTQTTITGKSLVFDDGVLSLKLPTISTLFVGFGVYFSSVNYATHICGFASEANHSYPSNPTHGMRLILNADATISIKNNNTGAIVATSTLKISAYVWNYFEIKYVFGSGASGTFQVKVNGTDFINATSIDTACTAASVNCFYFQNYISAGTVLCYYDDFYVCDDAGSTNNTFLGPINVYTLVPSANSATVQMTASAGSNYACVDEVPANTTDYVTATASNQVDLYTMADLPAGVNPTSVTGVLVKSKSANMTSTFSQIQYGVSYGGSTSFSSSMAVASFTYCINYQVFETQPNGSAWSAAALTGLDAGIKVV